MKNAERVAVNLDGRPLAAWRWGNGPATLLVIHDRDDPDVPVRDGIEIAAAWPGGRLVETTGLGHNRLLRDPDVIARAVAFLAGADDKGGAEARS